MSPCNKIRIRKIRTYFLNAEGVATEIEELNTPNLRMRLIQNGLAKGNHVCERLVLRQTVIR
jgi:hypothetical protein